MRVRLEKTERRLPWRLALGFGGTKPSPPGVTAVPVWAVGVFLAWAGIAAATRWFSPVLDHAPQLCLFKRITGLPCPTCGTTRGMMSLLHGDVVSAWLYNPMVFAVLAVLLAVFLTRLLFGRRVRVELGPREKLVFWCGVGALALANWAYVIRFVG